jgi:4-oxalomesaconate tautomerase
MSQISIPFSLIRGGSSKGVFLLNRDLPQSEDLRNKIILDIMEGVGHGDHRQIDGLGGADSLTAKVAVVSLSEDPKAEIDYMFYQVVIGKGILSTKQNCGNILAGVLPFAIQEKLIDAKNGKTTAIIKMLNSNSYCEVTIETPNQKVNYKGDTKIDGVPETGAPIICNYLDVSGENTGALLSTGNPRDIVDGIEVTCVDNGMPIVLVKAKDLNITGYETILELDNNQALKNKLENIRLIMGPKMNLGDVSNTTVPKMTIIAPAIAGGLIHTRTFIPHVCHAAIGVLGAVSVATGCIIPGSIASDMISFNDIKIGGTHTFIVEHPSGSLEVNLEIQQQNEAFTFPKSGVLRTARIIARGEAYLPN